MVNENFQIDPDDPFEEEIMNVIQSISDLRKIFYEEPEEKVGDYIGETEETSL